MTPMLKDVRRRQLLRLLQRLKSLILKDLEENIRGQIKSNLLQLDESYLKNEISIDDYKLKSIALLTKFWDSCRVEQFLYKEAGKLLSQQEIFTLTELSQNLRD